MKIDNGYILQPRKIEKSEIMQMPPVTRELWFYLIRNVQHKDYKKLKRGQGYFRLNDIQEDLSWMVGYRKEKYSKPQLTKSLRRLREGNMIETTKATHGILVTICKYNVYQDPNNYEGNDEGNAKETRRKRKGININKNDKNEFKKNWKKILKQVKREKKDDPLYKNKNFDKVMKEFLEGIEIKDYGYKNYYLAYLKWVRNSKHTISTSKLKRF